MSGRFIAIVRLTVARHAIPLIDLLDIEFCALQTRLAKASSGFENAFQDLNPKYNDV
jgi:hypothetical protein